MYVGVSTATGILGCGNTSYMPQCSAFKHLSSDNNRKRQERNAQKERKSSCRRGPPNRDLVMCPSFVYMQTYFNQSKQVAVLAFEEGIEKGPNNSKKRSLSSLELESA